MSRALVFEIGKQREDPSYLLCAIPPLSEMSFRQKKSERLNIRLSSKENLEKVVELVARGAVSESPSKCSSKTLLVWKA